MIESNVFFCVYVFCLVLVLFFCGLYFGLFLFFARS